MKFKAKQLQDALEHFKYTLRVPMESADIEVNIREEDIAQDKLVSSLTLFVCFEVTATGYDKWKGNKVVKHTLEIFPESEGRESLLTTEEAMVLPPRKD